MHYSFGTESAFANTQNLSDVTEVEVAHFMRLFARW